MKKLFLVSMLCCLLGVQGAWAEDKVAMLICCESDADVSAARTWFNGSYNISSTKKEELALANLKSLTMEALLEYKVIWVYMDGTNDKDYLYGLEDAHVEKLKSYVEAGGNLLLTGHAAKLAWKIGRAPDITTYGTGSTNNGDTWGVTTKIYRTDAAKVYDHSSHPLYAGVTQTDGYLYPLVAINDKQDHNCMWSSNDEAYVPWLEINYNCVVLGTWQQESNYKNAGIVEFQPMGSYKGRVLAIGVAAYQWANNNGDCLTNVQTMTSNALNYLKEKYDVQYSNKKRVAYLLPVNLGRNDSYDSSDYQAAALAAVDQDDEKTALQWFIDEIVSKDKGVIIEPKDLPDLDPNEITTVWVNIDRDGQNAWLYEHTYQNASESAGNASGLWAENIKQLLHRYVANAGNLLLTKSAVQLALGMGRTSNKPWTTDGRAEGGSVGIKNNDDSWVINPVIGGGLITGGALGYVSYKEDPKGTYNIETAYVADGYDHHEDPLYFNMKSDDTTYPLAQIGGETKYFVYYIAGPGVKEDHNCLWDGIDAVDFQTKNTCTILGQWGHLSGLSNAAIVKFNSTLEKGTVGDGWEGQILTLGLGAYEWQPSNADGGAREGENPYINNIKQLTYNALNILEGKNTESTQTYYYGGVKYTLTTRGVLHYAKIEGVDSNDSQTDVNLQVYDLTENNGLISNGTIKDDKGVVYNITNIAEGAFTQCKSLAYADLMKFQGVVPSSTDIRNYFPAWTLIYVPREEVIELNRCAVKGENIVNTFISGQYVSETDKTIVPDGGDDIKQSEKLQIYDNEEGTDNTTGWVYHFFANKYQFTANAVGFNRSFTANTKSTVALPFAIAEGELADFGTFYGFEGLVSGEKVKFKEVAATEANKPYMIVPKKNGKISISNVTKDIVVLDGTPTFDTSTGKYTLTSTVPYSVEKTGASFITDYRPQKFPEAKSLGIYCYYPDGEYKTTSSGTIWADPFRGYVKLSTPSSAPAAFAVLFEDLDGSTTAIGEVPVVSEQPDVYYTLSGMPVKNPTPGVYIKNNKKVIIK